MPLTPNQKTKILIAIITMIIGVLSFLFKSAIKKVFSSDTAKKEKTVSVKEGNTSTDSSTQHNSTLVQNNSNSGDVNTEIVQGDKIASQNNYYTVERSVLMERVEAKFGAIEAKNKSQKVLVKIGRSKSGFLLDGTTVLWADKTIVPMFGVYKKDGKLIVNAVIRKDKDHVIAVVEDNTWTVFDDNYEYNNDETGFELVTRGERLVFFQVFFEEDYVSVSGFFIGKSGYGIAAAQGSALKYPPKSDTSGAILGVIIPSRSNEEFDFVFTNTHKLFKYPRGKYLGVRDK